MFHLCRFQSSHFMCFIHSEIHFNSSSHVVILSFFILHTQKRNSKRKRADKCFNQSYQLEFDTMFMAEWITNYWNEFNLARATYFLFWVIYSHCPAPFHRCKKTKCERKNPILPIFTCNLLSTINQYATLEIVVRLNCFFVVLQQLQSNRYPTKKTASFPSIFHVVSIRSSNLCHQQYWSDRWR